MLRVKLPKWRQVYATTFIPSIVKETKTFKKDRIDNSIIEYLSKARKSTDSKSYYENYIKRKRIIDKCFAEKTPVLDIKEIAKDATAEPITKCNIELYSHEVRNKPPISNFKNNEHKIINKQAQQNITVKTVAANTEETKLAHDIVHKEKILDVEIDVTNSLRDIGIESTIQNTGKFKKLAESIDADQTHDTDIEKPNIEEFGTKRVPALLQNINNKTTTGNAGGEKLFRNVVNIDNTTDIDFGTQNGLHSTSKVTDIQSENKIECGTVNINLPETREDSNIAAKKKYERKLSQHVVSIDEASDIPKDTLLNSTTKQSKSQSFTAQITTAKTEEQQLSQKIEHIDETPHVEAGVCKVPGFNSSPKVLGHDTSHNLYLNEPFSDPIEKVNLDDLAKKCLGKPDGDIDKILLQELNNMSRDQSMKFTVPRDGTNQKYFSEIIEDETKKVLREELKDVTDNEKRFDKFYPFHLDTVPLVATDTRDFKNDFKGNFSPDWFKNVLLEIPAVLDPYDMQAIPFYEYVSKGNIVLQELNCETLETDIICLKNEEVILERGDLNFQEPIEKEIRNEEIKELDKPESNEHISYRANAFESLPDVDPFSTSMGKPSLSEADVAKLLEYKNVLMAQQESLGPISSNNLSSEITAENDSRKSLPFSSTVQEHPFKNAAITTLSTTVPPTDAFGNPIHSEFYQPISTGSSSLQAETDSRADGQNSDTAISANQEPGEYFPTSHLNSFESSNIDQAEYIISGSSITYTGVFDTKFLGGDTAHDIATDSLVSRSISFYSAFPQLLNFQEHTIISTFRQHLEKQERITDVYIETEPKRQNIGKEMAQTEPKREDMQEEMIEPELEQEEIVHPGPKRSEVTASPFIKENAKPLAEETIPLSVLLRRVRQKNRLELISAVKIDEEIAKKPNCLPPLDKSKPKTTLQPSPCQQPKPKEKDPQPCKPPQKKDPCAKFVPFFLGSILESNIDSNSVPNIPKGIFYDQISTYITFGKDITLEKLQHLRCTLGFLNIERIGDKFDELTYARDFDPWIPIPSWPIPKTEKKGTVVCPKEGCKLPVRPVRPNTDKPCLGMPKKISPTKTFITPLPID